MTEQEIVETMREKLRESEYGRVRAARDFNLSAHDARRLLIIAASGIDVPDKQILHKQFKQEEKNESKEVKTMGITMDELRSKIDNAFIVQKNADKLEKDRFLTQPEFIQTCGFASGGYKFAIELPKFAKYRGKAGSVIYWGHPESILELKSEGHLKDV